VRSWLDRFLSRTGSVTAGAAKGNFAIGVEGNVTQVYVQASADIFPGALAEPDLPFAELSEAIVDGKPDISRLLRWNYRLVETLHGRDDDLDAILNWAESDDPQVLLRFVEGEGGSGKTRLAAEAALRLRKRGWSAGFLRRAERIVHPASAKGLFLIIDYPEEQPQRIAKLIEAIRDNRRPGYRLRILLLSRSRFERWGEAFAPIRDLCGSQSIAYLGSLSVKETRTLIIDAVRRFSELMRRSQPDLSGLDSWITQDDEHRLSLYASAAAVHLLLSPTPTFGLSAPKILYELIERELARLGAASIAASLGPQALQRLLALATLTGSLTADGVKRLAAPALEIVDRTQCTEAQIIDRFHSLPWWDRETQTLPALVPDLVAAGLTAQVLDARPDLAPNWLWPAIEDRIDEDFASRLGRVIYDIDRVKLDRPTDLPLWLEQMVDGDPGRAVALLPLCAETALPHRLAGVAARVGMTVAGSDATAADEVMLAMILTNASEDLRNAGRLPESLVAAQRAVKSYEHLASNDPGRFESGLAMSQGNLGNVLSAMGQKGPALEAASRSTEIFERLVEIDRGKWEPEFAQSLANLANAQFLVGDFARAITTSRRGVAIRERLAEANKEQRFQYDLALSVANLAMLLNIADDTPEPLALLRRALSILERLASQNPELFEPELATTASNLALILMSAGMSADASAMAGRAIEINERLMAANPSRFESELGRDLMILALSAQMESDLEVACRAAMRAVPIFRKAFTALPLRYRDRYLHALKFSADVCRSLGRDTDAATMDEEIKTVSQHAIGN
jgi:tetratricopeptide (TPR) repeat protein